MIMADRAGGTPCVSNAKKLRIGDRLAFGEGLLAIIEAAPDNRTRTIAFDWDGSDADLALTLDRIGETPLPPYMNRDAEPEDKQRYQTLFATHAGAVAAPTAGLHFTPRLMDELRRLAASKRRASRCTSGWARFRLSKSKTPPTTTMHAEQFSISKRDRRVRRRAARDGEGGCWPSGRPSCARSSPTR